MGGPGAQGGCWGRLAGGGAHLPAWLPMRPVPSTPPPAGGGSSPPTPCGAGGPGPRGRALPGPTFAAPGAACGSSAAITVPGQGRGLLRRSGRGWVLWGHGDWWRWRARGSSRSPVPWGARGAGSRADVDSVGPWVRAHGLRLGVWFGFAVAAVAGHLLDVAWHRGLVGGPGRCLWTLVLFWSGRGWSGPLGCGL